MRNLPVCRPPPGDGEGSEHRLPGHLDTPDLPGEMSAKDSATVARTLMQRFGSAFNLEKRAIAPSCAVTLAGSAAWRLVFAGCAAYTLPVYFPCTDRIRISLHDRYQAQGQDLIRRGPQSHFERQDGSGLIKAGAGTIAGITRERRGLISWPGEVNWENCRSITPLSP